MNPNAIVTLLILEATGFTVAAALFGTAIVNTVKFNRDPKRLRESAETQEEAFADLTKQIEALTT